MMALLSFLDLAVLPCRIILTHTDGKGQGWGCLTHEMASHRVCGETRADIHWKASFHPWDFGPLLVLGPWWPDLDDIIRGYQVLYKMGAKEDQRRRWVTEWQCLTCQGWAKGPARWGRSPEAHLGCWSWGSHPGGQVPTDGEELCRATRISYFNRNKTEAKWQSITSGTQNHWHLPLQCFLVLFRFFAVLVIESRTSPMLNKQSTTSHIPSLCTGSHGNL